jgi:hypothetical protein
VVVVVVRALISSKEEPPLQNTSGLGRNKNKIMGADGPKTKNDFTRLAANYHPVLSLSQD